MLTAVGGGEDGDVGVRVAGRTKDALSHVSFAVPAGAMVAIVGATGSGKSTLARLALRFWDVSGGAIRLDGADISHLSLHDLRGAIALVEQTPFLFAGSVWENITLGTPEATKAQVEQAAQQAAIHGDITSWPDGYHTRVGERGQTLSGGQRQRLALARALVRGARVIVLDESTAHQDAVTQGVIMNQLRETGTTLLVIAHRLETVTSAHNVVVLDGGKLVEHGTPTQLLANGGEFARLAAIIN